MIKAFRELYHFIRKFNMRQEELEITITFKDINSLSHFQWESNKGLHWPNPYIDFREGMIYGIPFKLKVKDEY